MDISIWSTLPGDVGFQIASQFKHHPYLFHFYFYFYLFIIIIIYFFFFLNCIEQRYPTKKFLELYPKKKKKKKILELLGGNV